MLLEQLGDELQQISEASEVGDFQEIVFVVRCEDDEGVLKPTNDSRIPGVQQWGRQVVRKSDLPGVPQTTAHLIERAGFEPPQNTHRVAHPPKIQGSARESVLRQFGV